SLPCCFISGPGMVLWIRRSNGLTASWSRWKLLTRSTNARGLRTAKGKAYCNRDPFHARPGWVDAPTDTPRYSCRAVASSDVRPGTWLYTGQFGRGAARLGL